MKQVRTLAYDTVRATLFAAASLLTAAVLSAPLSGQGRPITDRDLLGFRWVADPQISPDGSQVAYTLVTVNEKENRYDTSIWVVSTTGGGSPRRLTTGPRNGAPRWAPDQRTLAFIRATNDTSGAQVYLLPLTGGEPHKLTDVPRGVGAPVWSPNGRSLAFTSQALPRDTATAVRDSATKKLLSDVRIITRAEYRSNDHGWLDPARHSHIWRVDLPDSGEGPVAAQQLTFGQYDEEELSWARDGDHLLFVSDRV